MKLGNHVEALELSMSMGGNASTIYPVLLWDDHGAVLVDTGMPGQLGAIKEAVDKAGCKFEDIHNIILTHQDIDHIGGLPEILEALGNQVEVWAHDDDVGYIQGEKPLIKLNRERMAPMFEKLPEPARSQAMSILDNPPKAHVDHILHGGEELPFHGGIQVIHTPGHTPGHLCLYVKSEKLLIAADELRVVDGELVGPAEGATPDMPTAKRSLSKLPPYEVEKVICYHGGFYTDKVQQRLVELDREANG